MQEAPAEKMKVGPSPLMTDVGDRVIALSQLSILQPPGWGWPVCAHGYTLTVVHPTRPQHSLRHPYLLSTR